MPGTKQDPETNKNPEQSSPVTSGEPFQRAASVLNAGDADSKDRSEEALVSIEDRAAAAQKSERTDDSDAVSRRLTGDEHDDDDKLVEALEDKALEDGVAAANDTAHIVEGLTPQSI